MDTSCVGMRMPVFAFGDLLPVACQYFSTKILSTGAGAATTYTLFFSFYYVINYAQQLQGRGFGG